MVMKYLSVLMGMLMGVVVIGGISPKDSLALQGVAASESNINNLKRDLRLGRIQVGKTRLKNVQRLYGEAASITDSEKKIIYDYGNLRLEFSKDRYLKEWERDSFKKPVYTESIDDLRRSLEGDEIVGDLISLKSIKSDYGDPTEVKEKNQDGDLSVYYYGDLKLTFENHFVVIKWRGNDLTEKSSSDILQVK